LFHHGGERLQSVGVETGLSFTEDELEIGGDVLENSVFVPMKNRNVAFVWSPVSLMSTTMVA
jgi:hypothetical protein